MAPFHLRSFYIANLFFIGSCSFRNVLRKSTFLSASLAANSMPQVQAHVHQLKTLYHCILEVRDNKAKHISKI
jgi:hypothetical protein